jgi:hypothetical protein
VHDIEHLVKAGCSLEQAWMIVRPVDKPSVVASAATDSSVRRASLGQWSVCVVVSAPTDL